MQRDLYLKCCWATIYKKSECCWWSYSSYMWPTSHWWYCISHLKFIRHLQQSVCCSSSFRYFVHPDYAVMIDRSIEMYWGYPASSKSQQIPGSWLDVHPNFSFIWQVTQVQAVEHVTLTMDGDNVQTVSDNTLVTNRLISQHQYHLSPYLPPPSVLKRSQPLSIKSQTVVKVQG